MPHSKWGILLFQVFTCVLHDVVIRALFFPSFLLIGGLLPFWSDLGRLAPMRRALLGINASVVGILLAVPGSLLWLAVKPEALQRLRAQAQECGIDPHRLVAAPYQKPVERFIAAMCCADLFLDTAGFNAGAIGVLALNVGLPLLTIAGDRFCSRMGASLCKAVHQPQLITTTPDAYEQKAIELASTPGAIAQLRAQLHSNPQGLPLFQQRRWVNSLVAALNA